MLRALLLDLAVPSGVLADVEASAGAILTAMDGNGDGRVDFPEFVEYFIRRGCGGNGDNTSGGGGHLIGLLRLLLNPAALVSSKESAVAQIVETLLPTSSVAPLAAARTPVSFGAFEPPSSAETAEPVAPPISGKKLVMSSMMVKAAANDPLFLKRVGLADSASGVSAASVSECSVCGAPLVGKGGLTQMGIDFCGVPCRDRSLVLAQARVHHLAKFGGGTFRAPTQGDYGWDRERQRHYSNLYRRTRF